jgi:hypothetical protein
MLAGGISFGVGAGSELRAGHKLTPSPCGAAAVIATRAGGIGLALRRHS